MLSLCEYGKCSRCPVCRQTEWRKKQICKSKIVPENVNVEVVIEEKIKDVEFKYIYCFLANIIMYIVASWLFGCLTILLFLPTVLNIDYVILWLPILVGLIEISFCFYCCVTRVCNLDIREDSTFNLLNLT
jgi:hypothetical protein